MGTLTGWRSGLGPSLLAAVALLASSTGSLAQEAGTGNAAAPPVEVAADQPASPTQQSAGDASAAQAAAVADPWTIEVAVDTLWTLVAAFLVFFMNAGFGCVEAGFCRAKNAVNILGKNFVVFGIASLAFWIFGWAIMFGDGTSFMGTSGWFVLGADNSPHTGDAYQGVYSSINWTGIPLFATKDAPGGIDRSGLFYDAAEGVTLLGYQALGVLAVGAFTCLFSLVAWSIIKTAVGLRVEAEAEMQGLDLVEMGMEAYAIDPMGLPD